MRFKCVIGEMSWINSLSVLPNSTLFIFLVNICAILASSLIFRLMINVDCLEAQELEVRSYNKALKDVEGEVIRRFCAS